MRFFQKNKKIVYDFCGALEAFHQAADTGKWTEREGENMQPGAADWDEDFLHPYMGNLLNQSSYPASLEYINKIEKNHKIKSPSTPK